MRCLTTANLIALTATIGLAVPAQAGSISGTITGDATLTPTGTPGVYVQNFSGEGDDTYFGSFTPTSSSMIDVSNPPKIVSSDVMFLETFTQGTLFGTGSGSGTASGNGTATVTIDLVFTGGTGLFLGVTGEATLTGTLTRTGATSDSFSGSYVGTLSIPEPGSLALLSPAAALGVVIVGLRRSRARQKAH